MIFGYWDAFDDALDDVDSKIPSEENVEIWKARNAYIAENYSELVLPKYMYEDILGTCENVGNEEDGYYVECGTWGYWTKTADALDSHDAWIVDYNGFVGDNGVGDFSNGLRPVITLSK